MSVSERESHVFKDGKVVQISPSMIKSTATCQVIVWKRYWMEEKTPPAMSLMKGSAVDAGANAAFESKLQGKELPVSEAVDMSIAKLESEYMKAQGTDRIYLDEEESGPNPLAMAKDDLSRGIPIFWQEQIGGIDPDPRFKVQQAFDLSYKSIPGVAVRGVVDVISNDGLGNKGVRVHDVKTAKKKWAAGREQHEIQPAFYVQGVESLLRAPVDGFEFNILAFNKTRATTEARELLPPREQMKKLPILIKAQVQQLNAFGAGADPLPTGHLADHYLCSHKYCGYAPWCEKNFGVRIKP